MNHPARRINEAHHVGVRRVPAPPARLVLNAAQAQAVYEAMRALNKVSARISSLIVGDFTVHQRHDGVVMIVDDNNQNVAAYADQKMFLQAYGLDASN